MAASEKSTRGRGEGAVQAGPYRLSVAYELDDAGVPQVTAFTVEHTEGGTLPVDLRAQLARQLDQVAAYVYAHAVAEQARIVVLGEGTLTLRTADGDEWTGPARRVEAGSDDDVARDRARIYEDVQRKRRRRDMTPEHLQAVAEAVTDSPGVLAARAVARRFQVSQPTAYRWVKQARDEGYLTDESEG